MKTFKVSYRDRSVIVKTISASRALWTGAKILGVKVTKVAALQINPAKGKK